MSWSSWVHSAIILATRWGLLVIVRIAGLPVRQLLLHRYRWPRWCRPRHATRVAPPCASPPGIDSTPARLRTSDVALGSFHSFSPAAAPP